MSAIDLMNGDKEAQCEERWKNDPDWTECWEIATEQLRDALDKQGYDWFTQTERFSLPPRDFGGERYEIAYFRTRVPLGNGCTLSVVSGRSLYSVPAAPYEAMLVTPDGGLTGVALDGEEYDDPWAYQTLDEVMAILKRVEVL